MPKNWAVGRVVWEGERGDPKFLDWLYLRCTVFAIRFDETRASNKKKDPELVSESLIRSEGFADVKECIRR